MIEDGIVAGAAARPQVRPPAALLGPAKRTPRPDAWTSATSTRWRWSCGRPTTRPRSTASSAWWSASRTCPPRSGCGTATDGAVGGHQGDRHPGRAGRRGRPAAGAAAVRRGAAAGHRHRPVGRRPVPLRLLLGHRRAEAVRRAATRSTRCETGSVRLGGIVGRAAHPSARTSRWPAARRWSRSAATAGGSTSPTRCTAPGTTSSTPTAWAPGWPRSTSTRRRRHRASTSGSSRTATSSAAGGSHQIRLQGGDASSDSYCYPVTGLAPAGWPLVGARRVPRPQPRRWAGCSRWPGLQETQPRRCCCGRCRRSPPGTWPRSRRSRRGHRRPRSVVAAQRRWRSVGGVVLVGFGLWRLLSQRHFRWAGMRLSAGAAGRLVVPDVVGARRRADAAAGAGRRGPAPGDMPRIWWPGRRRVARRPRRCPGWPRPGVHTVAMFAVMAVCAVVVYSSSGWRCCGGPGSTWTGCGRRSWSRAGALTIALTA